VVNADGLLGGRYFLDNTHVNRAGAQRFAQALSAPVAQLLDVL
jgi:lysophospholipase L1-like esterase